MAEKWVEYHNLGEVKTEGRKKWAIKKAIERRDEELRAQEEEFKALGTCPKCHIMKTMSGNCSMGCN